MYSYFLAIKVNKQAHYTSYFFINTTMLPQGRKLTLCSIRKSADADHAM